MKHYSHRVHHALLSAALLAIGACGGSESDNEDATGLAASNNACAGLSVDAAAEVLDVDADELVRRAMPGAAVSCSFSSPSDPGKVLAYSVRLLDSDAAATARLDSMARMLAKISPVERADAPGDAALFAPGNAARRAAMRRGRLVIDLVEPTDPELQRRALGAIVAGL